MKKARTTTPRPSNPGSNPRKPRKTVAAPEPDVQPINDSNDMLESDLEAQAAPSSEQIERRAYELFLARGGAHGDPMADWLQAERELRGQA